MKPSPHTKLNFWLSLSVKQHWNRCSVSIENKFIFKTHDFTLSMSWLFWLAVWCFVTTAFALIQHNDEVYLTKELILSFFSFRVTSIADHLNVGFALIHKEVLLHIKSIYSVSFSFWVNTCNSRKVICIFLSKGENRWRFVALKIQTRVWANHY